MIRVLKALGAEPTPSKPGPGQVPESLLKALELTIARRVEGLLAGDHRSALLGRGTELAQVRPYVPGDDVRLIDWNVTARTTEPHVRVHLAERSKTPVLGDPLYGKPPKKPALRAIAEELGRQALHARVLGFVHPATHEPVRWESALPADMRRALDQLRGLATRSSI